MARRITIHNYLSEDVRLDDGTVVPKSTIVNEISEARLNELEKRFKDNGIRVKRDNMGNVFLGAKEVDNPTHNNPYLSVKKSTNELILEELKELSKISKKTHDLLSIGFTERDKKIDALISIMSEPKKSVKKKANNEKN